MVAGCIRAMLQHFLTRKILNCSLECFCDFNDHNVKSLMFKGVKKMVVVDNLLYVLDTEVSSMIPPVDTVSNTIESLLHKFYLAGYSESLGPAFSCGDSLLARSHHP